MTDKIGKNIPQDKMKLYEQLVATQPGIELKGKNNPYTSHNGHMFTFISKDGVLAIRLPKDEREKFLKEYKTTLMESYGAVMKEYVRVPDKLIQDTAVLARYMKISYKYVKMLKPKPSKK